MIRKAKYGKGDVIISEGDDTSEAYFLERGRVEVFRAGPPYQPLTVLESGAVFGEMAWITERPRSASVRALDEVEASVLGRDDFLTVLRTQPDAVLPIMRVLCERVRSLTALVGELSRRPLDCGEAIRAHMGADAAALVGVAPAAAVTPAAPDVLVEGLTPPTRAAMGSRPLSVTRFPFRIGRRTRDDDPFSHNELGIVDEAPFHLSRDHCLLALVDGRCFLVDRGSRLGTSVDGDVVASGERVGRVELHAGAHDIALGGVTTPYRFRITISRRT